MISRFFLLKLDKFTDRIKTSWFPKMITGLIGFPLTTKLLDVFKVRGWEKSRLLFKNTFFVIPEYFSEIFTMNTLPKSADLIILAKIEFSSPEKFITFAKFGFRQK